MEVSDSGPALERTRQATVEQRIAAMEEAFRRKKRLFGLGFA
jgi:hypothetical protein